MKSNGNNSDNPQRNHTRFIVGCITWLGTLALVGGTVLTFKGYNAELLIGAGGVGAVSGLLGMLSNAKPVPPQPNVTVSGSPPVAQVTNTPTLAPEVPKT